VLLLVRHGESTGNAQRLLLGRIDAPLTSRGRDQVKSLRPQVAGAARVISSPLGRARDTAAALGLGLPVEVDERWIEMDYGELDGVPLRDVPGDTWNRWRSDPGFHPAGGESLAEVGRRVRSACEELFERDRHGARGGDVVVVSHVSPIKAATCWALGSGDEGTWRLSLGTASITRVGWGPGIPVLHGYNHTPWSESELGDQPRR